MQCENCGYIFFRPSKKCTCCDAPYTPAQSSFDVGQEHLFTIFEMAPGEGGISSSMGMAEAPTGVEDYNFTDDFDTGGAEYGVDENVLDLSDAEAEGYGASAAAASMGVGEFEFETSGMDNIPSREDAGPDDFDLDISEDLPDNESVSTETPVVESDESMDMDYGGGFDEVEGLGFGFDESPADESPEADTGEISLDDSLEPEISLEPELELPEEEPSLELSEELELDTTEEQPSMELSEDSLELSDEFDVDTGEFNAVDEEPSLELSDEFDVDTGEFNAVGEEPSLELPDDLDLAEEPELMEPPMDEYADLEGDGGVEFDLDNVDLDEPEEVSFLGGEVEEITESEEPFMDLEGLEMETPGEPEDEDLKP
jgi:hypothetical protein